MGKSFLTQFLKLFNSSDTNVAPSTSPTKRDEWSIGIYFGQSPFHFALPETVRNPILTRENVSDVPAAYVADPFMLRVNDTWYLFFEVMNRQTGKGEIGLAVSENGVNWKYQHIVLDEPFHLSYPYVFQWKNEFYMVPESFQTNSIRLYKADAFPLRWSFMKTILHGRDYVDSSLVHFKEKWWLFTSLGVPPCRADNLHLFYADELIGTWHEHVQSPIVSGNAHIARPGGRVIVFNDKVIRYTQDCSPIYGTQVRAFEISELTTRSYCEHIIPGNPILCPSGRGWNESGMHHIDPHPMGEGTWIACVDGWRWVNA